MMKKNDCPFCQRTTMKILFETKSFYFAEDNFPITLGHCLLIPKDHIRTEGEIKQKKEFGRICDQAWEYIDKVYSSPITVTHPPQLQTVPHYHRHYIPLMNQEKGFVLLALQQRNYLLQLKKK